MSKFCRTFALLTFCALWALPLYSQNSTFTVGEYYGNEGFKFSENVDFLKVELDKKVFETFSLKASDFDVKALNHCSFQLRASKLCFIKVSISDGQTIVQPSTINYRRLEQSTDFTTVSFDFSDVENVINEKSELFFIFHVQAGSDFRGVLDIKYNVTGNPKNAHQQNPECFKTYPVPAQNCVYVYPPNGSYKEIRLYNSFQQVVKQQTIKGKKEVYVDLSDLRPGAYTLQLLGNNKSIEKTILKQ